MSHLIQANCFMNDLTTSDNDVKTKFHVPMFISEKVSISWCCIPCGRPFQRGETFWWFVTSYLCRITQVSFVDNDFCDTSEWKIHYIGPTNKRSVCMCMCTCCLHSQSRLFRCHTNKEWETSQKFTRICKYMCTCVNSKPYIHKVYADIYDPKWNISLDL